MTKLLLDADVLAYQTAFFHEVATEVEPGYWTWYVDYNKVLDSIHDRISWLQKTLDADEYILCLSDTKNFRQDLSGTYKGKRSNLRRPIVLKEVRKYFLEQGAVLIENLEGDDVMGILADEDTIIVSIDKDMRTIPGRYYKDQEKGVEVITEEEANYNHFFQTIVGDPIDGYSGCPGVGKVGAKDILEKDCSWASVVRTFRKKGIREEEALLQARLARILRKGDYEEGKIRLWTPF